MTNFISTLLKSQSVDNDRLCEVLSGHFETDDLLRIYGYITGSEELPVINSTSDKVKEKSATFISYDIFDNTVHYSYLEERERWFDSEEKAAEVDGKILDTGTGSWKQDGNYQFPATYYVKCYNNTKLHYWQ